MVTCVGFVSVRGVCWMESEIIVAKNKRIIRDSIWITFIKFE
jgi:hypothetical protein